MCDPELGPNPEKKKIAIKFIIGTNDKIQL